MTEVDLIDLVRQHGDKLRMAGMATADGSAPSQYHAQRDARELFTRIEAEVQRLRDLPGVAERQCDEHHAEVERLREVVRKKHAEIESQATGFLEATNKLIAEREWAKGERDEALAEVERLKADRSAAPGRTEQARNVHGLPWWIHACGVTWPQSVLPNPDECLACPDKPGPWRPLLIATDAPQPDGPVVLTLPSVPEGAVALIDRHKRRWTLTSDPAHRLDDGEQLWASDSGGLRNYGALLVGSGPLTVEMAPPREPRTWPKLDTMDSDDDDPIVVDVDGHGRWRLDHGRGLYGNGLGDWCSLRELQHLGDVTEVFDA